MKPIKLACLVSALLISSFAFGKEGKARYAIESDIPGYWSVLLLDRFESEGPIKNRDMFHGAACNVHVFKSDGKYINVISEVGVTDTVKKTRCARTIAEVDKGLLAINSMSTTWSTWQALGAKNSGGFSTRGPTDPGDLSWQIVIVEEETDDPVQAQNFGFELKKGDLILNLLKRVQGSSFRVMWFTVLRRISE